MLKEKILSIPQHCSNKHVFIENKEHLTCSHGPLGDRTKAWLPSDSKVTIGILRKTSLGARHDRQNSKVKFPI